MIKILSLEESTEFLIVLLKDRMTLVLKGMRIKEIKVNCFG